MKFCNSCNAQLKDSAKFCNICGAKLEAEEVAQLEQIEALELADEPQPKEEKADFAISFTPPQKVTVAAEQPAEENEPQKSGLPTAEQPVPPVQPVYSQPVYNQAPQQPVYAQPYNAYGQPMYAQPIYTRPATLQRPPIAAVSALKQVIASPLFVISAIMFTLLFLFNVYSVLMADKSFATTIFFYLEKFDLGFYSLYEIWDIIDAIVTVLKVISVLSLIPALLTAIGLWVSFGASKNQQNPMMSTAGFSVLQAGAIINLVITCITCLPIVIIGFVFLSTGYQQGMIMGLAVLLVGTPYVIFAILYRSKIIGSISSASSCARGRTLAEPSTFVAVMCFLLAAIKIIGFMLPLVFSVKNPFLRPEGIEMVSDLLSIATSITFGVLIFVLRSKTNTVCYNSGYNRGMGYYG